MKIKFGFVKLFNITNPEDVERLINPIFSRYLPRIYTSLMESLRTEIFNEDPL